MYGLSWIPSVLLVVFVSLKLTNVIQWSWFWVFSPVWIVLSMIIIFGLCYMIMLQFETDEERTAREYRESINEIQNKNYRKRA
jgi:uncharacterized membrane protein